jgi:hypothetical protein
MEEVALHPGLEILLPPQKLNDLSAPIDIIFISKFLVDLKLGHITCKPALTVSTNE